MLVIVAPITALFILDKEELLTTSFVWGAQETDVFVGLCAYFEVVRYEARAQSDS